MQLLDAKERALVIGHVINRFRGDASILAPGFPMLEKYTGVPVIGVIPYFFDIDVPEEDSQGLDNQDLRGPETRLDVAVLRLPHIANFDDFDPLRQEIGVGVRFVRSKGEFGEPNLIILPGSKSTVADLIWLRKQGLADCVLEAHSRGTPIIGICAGFQMLGQELHDPLLIEAQQPFTPGLGLLATSTTFRQDKVTHRVVASVIEPRGMLRGCEGSDIAAYEIHMGSTIPGADSHPFRIETRSGNAAAAFEGALDESGLTLGTYMHGLFHNRHVRRSVLEFVAQRNGVALPESPSIDLDTEYDRLADLVIGHIDIAHVKRAMGLT